MNTNSVCWDRDRLNKATAVDLFSSSPLDAIVIDNDRRPTLAPENTASANSRRIQIAHVKKFFSVFVLDNYSAQITVPFDGRCFSANGGKLVVEYPGYQLPVVVVEISIYADSFGRSLHYECGTSTNFYCGKAAHSYQHKCVSAHQDLQSRRSLRLRIVAASIRRGRIICGLECACYFNVWNFGIREHQMCTQRQRKGRDTDYNHLNICEAAVV